MKLILAAAFFTTSLWGQTSNYCDVKGQKPNKVVKISRTPDYFFKASEDGKYIYYISNSQNYVLNTETMQEGRMPGIADPVSSPDGKIFSFLEKGWKLYLGVKDKDNKVSAFYTDNEARPYQSIGQSENKYRLFSQSESLGNYVLWSYRDYSLTNGSITSVSETINVPDSYHIRLPMMDKTGKFLIARNSNTEKSEIINVETGAVVETLPVGGGKSDFSFDGNKVTFHLTVNPSSQQKWLEESFGSIQDQALVRNIFVYDRPSKKLKQVTNFTEGSAFFPVFLKDGKIVYLFKTPENEFEFHIVNEPASSVRSKSVVENCMGVEEANSTMNKLVEKWFEACDNWASSANRTMAELAILNLPKEYCLSLGRAANVSGNDMEKFCDPKIEDKTLGNKPATPTSPAQTIMNNKCAVCHSDIPFNNEKDLANWGKKIEERLKSNDPNFRMPRGGSLSSSEKQTLLKYVQQLKQSK
ncbi:hypothetical protein ACJVC5_02335 [Peredibacter sp. HCB2-198]|uniref:hypothetical protein n=1 Tax=Peredibacter sp. HCB2-198 TaxID=3383025 RepID=UPI0038B4BA01